MKIEEDIKLDFNDVLIKPKRSKMSSRSEVNIERTFHFPNSKQTWTGVPIILLIWILLEHMKFIKNYQDIIS